MSTVSEVMQTLMDMGFHEEKVKLALAETSWKGVEPAMEWLLAHINDPVPSSGNGANETEEGEASTEEEGQSKPPPIVLTEEERKEKLAKLEELRIQKRKEREDSEKASEIDKEKKRISEGKVLSTIRKSHEDQEMKKIAEEQRREKLETQMAKERVKAQIEEDKQRRREEEERRRNPQLVIQKKALHLHPLPQPPPLWMPPQNTLRPAFKSACPTDPTLVQTFSVKEPLSAVRLFVAMNSKEVPKAPCNFMTSFPKKIFSEDEYQRPLESLDLVPSAVLIVKK
ncbi:SAPK substrate protein 1 [Caligus rogercresseyi]|uniref:SAPK substrate protein 1 n=1 Tax=Caligus rogercresseyi TaxID=217165 RepID=A0A7T8KE87_CALRO|nr:SAPK substrate protein 1 [Caligus rogercresseyi]